LTIKADSLKEINQKKQLVEEELDWIKH